MGVFLVCTESARKAPPPQFWGARGKKRPSLGIGMPPSEALTRHCVPPSPASGRGFGVVPSCSPSPACGRGGWGVRASFGFPKPCQTLGKRVPTTEQFLPSLVCRAKAIAMPKEALWNLLTGAMCLCYTKLMLLQTWVQLHILLSAAPALAGWMPYLHALPLGPGQAVYGVRATPCSVAVRAQHSAKMRLAPVVCALALPGEWTRRAQGLTAPGRVDGSAPRHRNRLASPHGPRAP